MLYDARMIPNLKLRDFVMDTARDAGVPLHPSAMEGGATDGSAIHLYQSGVPTVVLAVPARHIHSHSSIIHRDDYDAAVRLLVTLLEKLDAAQVADFQPVYPCQADEHRGGMSDLIERLSAELNQRIEAFHPQVEVRDVGSVTEAGDGIARVSGLSKARAQELVQFADGMLGIAFNLEAPRGCDHPG